MELGARVCHCRDEVTFMGIFNIFDTAEVERFAAGLSDDLARRFPPASERRTDPGASHQLKVILEGLGARAVRFKAEQGLGIYRKAKLGTIFKYKLKEAGYSDEFVERATGDIIRRITVN
jgi:hypothetical protein